MSLIRKPQELEVPQKIKALIYGQSGMGKSTLALSAPKPLLLDFDGGIHRVNYEHQVDTVQIRTWNEALQALREDLSAYETIVVDTIGKMMDYIIDYSCNGRTPMINDWTKINAEFSNFTRSVSSMNKHVIYVAHRDIRKEGDDNVFVPSLRERNYTSIVTELDLMGYLVMVGDKRTITFNPTNKNDGKNTCNLPGVMNIPVCVDKAGNALQNTFFQDQIITTYTQNFKKRLEEQKRYNETIAGIKDAVDVIVDSDMANDFADNIKNWQHIGNSLMVARKLFSAKVAELGLVLNKEKRYENPAA